MIPVWRYFHNGIGLFGVRIGLLFIGAIKADMHATWGLHWINIYDEGYSWSFGFRASKMEASNSPWRQ